MTKPVIGITMGDPSGIGPEITLKVLSKKEVYDRCLPFVIGDLEVMGIISRVLKRDLEIQTIQDLAEAKFTFSKIEVLCPEGVSIPEVHWGKVDPAMGKAAVLCLQEAFDLALQGKVDGVVSAPLNKEAFHLAGYPHLDELEYLGEMTHSVDPFVIGVMGTVWTVAVTLHVPFKEIANQIKRERILRYIQSIERVLKQVEIRDPRIAVAALNVHGGEGGKFGREEIDEIKPAIEEARGLGIHCEGPFPADTIFVRATDGEFDAVVCMYHDQANIARKLYAKGKGATLFMGLPVICGTTAHGTAFDIAGKGVADPGSLEQAVKLTALLASPREKT
jgi:4-hydroxythreonine-4-phosphate dehydrogenase